MEDQSLQESWGDSSDRDCPLVTATYGMRVAQPASATWLRLARTATTRGSGEASPGDNGLVGKPRSGAAVETVITR